MSKKADIAIKEIERLVKARVIEKYNVDELNENIGIGIINEKYIVEKKLFYDVVNYGIASFLKRSKEHCVEFIKEFELALDKKKIIEVRKEYIKSRSLEIDIEIRQFVNDNLKGIIYYNNIYTTNQEFIAALVLIIKQSFQLYHKSYTTKRNHHWKDTDYVILMRYHSKYLLLEYLSGRYEQNGLNYKDFKELGAMGTGKLVAVTKKTHAYNESFKALFIDPKDIYIDKIIEEYKGSKPKRLAYLLRALVEDKLIYGDINQSEVVRIFKSEFLFTGEYSSINYYNSILINKDLEKLKASEKKEVQKIRAEIKKLLEN